MDASREQRLAEFVSYAKSRSGDEKGEAQVFVDRLFRGFGRVGYKEAGATLEARVKNDRGGTAFADLVWKPVVLIEINKRGERRTRLMDGWGRARSDAVELRTDRRCGAWW